MPSIFSVCFQRLGIFGPCNHEIKNTYTHISCAPEPTQSRCTYYTLFFQIRCLGPDRVQNRYQGLPKYQGLSKLDRSFKRCLRWKHAWLSRAEVFTLHTSGHFLSYLSNPQLPVLTRSVTCSRGAHNLNAGRATPHTSPSVRRTSCRTEKPTPPAQKPLFTQPGTFAPHHPAAPRPHPLGYMW